MPGQVEDGAGTVCDNLEGHPFHMAAWESMSLMFDLSGIEAVYLKEEFEAT